MFNIWVLLGPSYRFIGVKNSVSWEMRIFFITWRIFIEDVSIANIWMIPIPLDFTSNIQVFWGGWAEEALPGRRLDNGGASHFFCQILLFYSAYCHCHNFHFVPQLKLKTAQLNLNFWGGWAEEALLGRRLDNGEASQGLVGQGNYSPGEVFDDDIDDLGGEGDGDHHDLPHHHHQVRCWTKIMVMRMTGRWQTSFLPLLFEEAFHNCYSDPF